MSMLRIRDLRELDATASVVRPASLDWADDTPESITLDIGCTFTFDVATPTQAVLMFEPPTGDNELIVASIVEVLQDGPVPSQVYVDVFGNRCRRVTFESGVVTIRYAAMVMVSDQPDLTVPTADVTEPTELPDEALQFLLPSRYCEVDQLTDLAWTTFGAIQPGWARVQAISDWTHERLAFRYGSSSPSHSAMTALASGEGVCRDFTHVAITMCRALNIPARYISGYLPDIGVPDPGTPMDFCAWMEVYLDGRWFTFDPRNNERRIGRVVIGRGRDAADVAMVTTFGPVVLRDMTVTAELTPTL